MPALEGEGGAVTGIPFGAAVGLGLRLNFATTRKSLDRAIEAIAAALRATSSIKPTNDRFTTLPRRVGSG